MKLPDGVTVHTAGQKFEGEIPDDLCPEHLKAPPAPAKKADAKSA